MSKGNFRNMKAMIKNAGKIQKEMLKMQEELEKEVVEGSAGGGAVVCKANAKKEVLEMKIDPDVVDPEDVEMLEDLVLAAINAAFEKADEKVSEGMNKITGGVNIPGL